MSRSCSFIIFEIHSSIVNKDIFIFIVAAKEVDGQYSKIEWNPANILELTRPVPLSAQPRKVIITGHARFEWLAVGGCPEVILHNMSHTKSLSNFRNSMVQHCRV